MTKGKLKKQEIGIEIRRDILGSQARKVFLSLGSNLGNKKKNLQIAKLYLSESKKIFIIRSSSYYSTPSWPNKNHPFFLNIALEIWTIYNPVELFHFIKNIERLLGRKKAPKNSPRLCDIDILDYNQKIFDIKINNEKLIIPHPRMHKRNFVLLPLFEISRQWKHPKLKVNIIELINSLTFDNLRSIKIM